MTILKLANADLTSAGGDPTATPPEAILETSTDGKYAVTGDGTFDRLMEAVNIHLAAQYDLGRIVGKEYAEVYLGAMQYAMQSAVSYVVEREKLELNYDTVTNKTVAELIKVYGFGSSIDPDTGKIILGDDTTEGKIDAETKLVITQEFDVAERTEIALQQSDKDLEVKDATLDQSDKDLKVKDATIGKTDAEKTLLIQKKISEDFQTTGDETSKGVLGKQMRLYDEQAKGFYWNSTQKWAKLAVDAAAIDTSNGYEADAGPTMTVVSGAYIGKVKPDADGSIVGDV